MVHVMADAKVVIQALKEDDDWSIRPVSRQLND